MKAKLRCSTKWGEHRGGGVTRKIYFHPKAGEEGLTREPYSPNRVACEVNFVLAQRVSNSHLFRIPLVVCRRGKRRRSVR